MASGSVVLAADLHNREEKPAVPRVSERIRYVLQAAADIPAIEFGEQITTWSEVGDFASALGALVGEADPEGGGAALVIRNRPSCAAAMAGLLAVERCVSIITAIQPTLSLCAEVESLRPAVIVAHALDWTDELEAAVGRVGGAGFVIGEADAGLSVGARPGLERAGAGARGEIPADAAILVPTSGTTGPAKRITVTWTWLERFVRATDAPIVRGRGVIHAIPLATTGGVLTMMPWATRPLTLVLMERLDVNRWADLVARHKPKFAGLPPAGLRTLLEARPPREKLESLRAFVTGSAPLDPALADAFEDAYGRPVLLTYGSTETGKVTGWPKDATIELRRGKRGSSGRVLADVEVRILDQETSAQLPTGELGIMEVKNPNARYQPPGGWIRTTDLGRLDEDGYLFIEGRADDVIIRGGFKVPLLELEQTMSRHPAVVHCAATGLPDERLGQVPAALVVLRPGVDPKPTEADFMAWLKERIAPYKAPVRVRFVDEIPLNAMLKTDRRMLRGLLADEPSAGPPMGRGDG